MFERTPLEGLFVYCPRIHRDERGCFFESFNKKHFQAEGLHCDFIQDNTSISIKGTVRGLHLQKAPFAQTKLIGVSQGAIFDVAVDLRPDSATFGKWFGIQLVAEDHKFLYIPRGFGHGFMALTEKARVSYKVDNAYNRDAEIGVRFDDPEVGIIWPSISDSSQTCISEKDLALPSLKEFLANSQGR